MQIKGKAVIELKDTRTGEVEIMEEENMVTNAVQRLFSDNIEGMFFNVGGSGGADWSDYHLPICPNAIGGILLFSDALVEDENNIYAPSANHCVGYASNNANPTANVMRGSLNLTESGKIDRGYKFVWDFATSQGNGTISAVALTHKRGGIGYYGDTYDAGNRWIQMKNTSVGLDGVDANRIIDVVEVNFEGNYIVAISRKSSNEIVVTKSRKCFRDIGLLFNLQENTTEILDEQVLVPETFIGSDYFDFHDGEDGYWYGFMGDSNSGGNATVRWLKIKKSDYSFSEGTWTLNNVHTQSMGYRSGYGGWPNRSVYHAVMNGYLYLMSYEKTGVYKVNLNNPADVTLLKFGFTSNYSGGNNYGTVQMWRMGDRVAGSDFIINSDDTVQKTVNNRDLNCICTPIFPYGPYGMSFGRYFYSSMSVYKTLWVLTPYLATINNLATSVIKTADKTMKITYTLTETD